MRTSVMTVIFLLSISCRPQALKKTTILLREIKGSIIAEKSAVDLNQMREGQLAAGGKKSSEDILGAMNDIGDIYDYVKRKYYGHAHSDDNVNYAPSISSGTNRAFIAPNSCHMCYTSRPSAENAILSICESGGQFFFNLEQTESCQPPK